MHTPRRRNFAEDESQVYFFIMVCEMKGLGVEEIRTEIAEHLHMKVSRAWVYDQIRKMEDVNAATFTQMKKSNTAYINEVMTLKNHLNYYRQILMQVLKGKEFQHQLTVNQIMKLVEFLYKIDETHFNMLKEMPKMFAWGGIRAGGRGGLGPVYGAVDNEQSEKDISQYITNIAQIPVPIDLERLQQETETEKLGAHTQDPFIISSSSSSSSKTKNDDITEKTTTTDQ